MLKLNPIASNVTELELVNGYVLFSYQTPVAFMMKSTGEIYKTTKKWSVTTSRHINKWLSKVAKYKNVIEKPQEWFDELVK